MMLLIDFVSPLLLEKAKRHLYVNFVRLQAEPRESSHGPVADLDSYVGVSIPGSSLSE